MVTSLKEQGKLDLRNNTYSTNSPFKLFRMWWQYCLGGIGNCDLNLYTGFDVDGSDLFHDL